MPAAGTVVIALRAARNATERQQQVDAWLARVDDARRASADGRGFAIIAEGAFSELVAPVQVAVVRLAPGCVCCVGWIPLRVHLQRAVRAGARSILLLVASDEHLARVREVLQKAPGFAVRLEETP